MSDLPIDEARELLEQWAPVLRFHPRNRFFPIDVDEYVAESALVPMVGLKPIVPRGELTWEKVLSEGNPGRLHVSDAFLLAAAEGKVRNRVYGVARRLDDGTLWLAYVFFYADNPGVAVCFPGCGVAGRHVSDTEQVHLLIDPEGQTLKRACYSAHGSRESTWYEPSELEMHDHTRPIVYVALGSHANYPTGGNRRRVYGFAVEQCARGGARDAKVLAKRKPMDDETKGEDFVAHPVPVGGYLTLDAQRFMHVLHAEHPWRKFGGKMALVSGWSIGAKGNLDFPAPARNTKRNERFRRFHVL